MSFSLPSRVMVDFLTETPILENECGMKMIGGMIHERMKSLLELSDEFALF